MQLLRSILDFIYPPLCQHCTSFLEPSHLFLCFDCFHDLDILDPGDYCHRCLALQGPSHRCQKSHLDGLFACLSDSPLARRLLQSSSPALAALLLYQWARLPWPTFDIVTSTPGNSHVDGLFSARTKAAKDLALLAEKPFLSPSHLMLDHLANPFKPLEAQTIPQDMRSITIVFPERIINKRILLIHDIITSNIALTHTAQALKQAGALEVYGLSICLA